MQGFQDSNMSFPAPIVYEPLEGHTHTIILLYAGERNTSEFTSYLFSLSTLPNPLLNLRARFPTWRWVFPRTHPMWYERLNRSISQWFQMETLRDVTVGQGQQALGIRDVMPSIFNILLGEVELVHGDFKKIFLGGTSQGGALALWVMLRMLTMGERLGGFIGLNVWLPFAPEVIDLVHRRRGRRSHDSEQLSTEEALVAIFVENSLMPITCRGDEEQILPHNLSALHDTPVFLGHGTDNTVVDVALGRQARNILACEPLGMQVIWREYVGTACTGHWLKAPEEVNDIVTFLENVERHT